MCSTATANDQQGRRNGLVGPQAQDRVHLPVATGALSTQEISINGSWREKVCGSMVSVSLWVWIFLIALCSIKQKLQFIGCARVRARTYRVNLGCIRSVYVNKDAVNDGYRDTSYSKFTVLWSVLTKCRHAMDII